MLSILASGGVWTGTNWTYKTEELAHHLISSKASVIVTRLEDVGVVEDAARISGREVRIVIFSDILMAPAKSMGGDMHDSPREADQGPWDTLHDLIEARPNGGALKHRVQNADATAVIFSSSGTTGRKYIMVAVLTDADQTW